MVLRATAEPTLPPPPRYNMGDCWEWEPLEQNRYGNSQVIVLERTKIDQQFSDGTPHATRAPYQNVFTKIWRIKEKTKRFRANKLIYLQYTTLQLFNIAWKLYIKQISFGRV